MTAFMIFIKTTVKPKWNSVKILKTLHVGLNSNEWRLIQTNLNKCALVLDELQLMLLNNKIILFLKTLKKMKYWL